MVARAGEDARDDVQRAVDALVGESSDAVSTHALGEDLIDIRQAIDRLEAEFIRRLHRFSLCRPHHRMVHEQGWRIHMADGVPVIEPPP